MSKVCVFLCPRERPVFGSTTSLHLAMGYTRDQGIEVEPLLMDEENTFGFHNLDIGLGDFLKTDCTHIFLGADAELGAKYRFGVKTGGFSAGTITGRLSL